MCDIPWGALFLFCFECLYDTSTTMAKSSSGLECSFSCTGFSFVIRPDEYDIDKWVVLIKEFQFFTCNFRWRCSTQDYE